MDTTPSIVAPPARPIGQGYAIALTGILLWSTTAIFISYLLERYTLAPLTLAFWRDLFTTSALAVILLVARPDLLHIARRHRLFLVSYGFSLAVMNTLWTYSVGLNGAAVSTVLVYSSPAFTALVARRLFGEPLTRLRVAAVCISICGCVLVSGAYTTDAWSVNPWGIVIGLASGLGFTFYSVMGKFSARREINPWTATLSAFAVATCILFFTQTGGTLFTLDRAIDGWAILLLLAIVPTLGGFGLYTTSLGYLPAGTANLIATLEPALTALLAFILLGESFSPIQLTGSLLILGSVVSLRGS
ncbi:MAG TPA: DMT family transporter [Anaerolineae bacterium]|nr:DMT family transporter [Anaerolineae bacterium]